MLEFFRYLALNCLFGEYYAGVALKALQEIIGGRLFFDFVLFNYLVL